MKFAQKFTKYLDSSKTTAAGPAKDGLAVADKLGEMTEAGYMAEGADGLAGAIENGGTIASMPTSTATAHAGLNAEFEARAKAAQPFTGAGHTIQPSVIAKMMAGDRAREQYGALAGPAQNSLVNIGKQRWFHGS
jgi:hypothetical protein